MIVQSELFYAHPCKQISHIKYFKEQGVELTVADNKNELIKIQTHWPNAKILIRLKTIDSQSLIPLSSKFGVNERVAIEMFEMARTLNLNIIGCTFHVGTGCYNTNTFIHILEFARRMFDIAKNPRYDLKFTVLDIGGGFPGENEPGKPKFTEMAKIINQALDKLFPDNEGTVLVCVC